MIRAEVGTLASGLQASVNILCSSSQTSCRGEQGNTPGNTRRMARRLH